MTSILLKKVLGAPGPDEAWLEGLLRWVLEASPSGGADSPRNRRLEELRSHLEDHPMAPAWRARIRQVLTHTSAVSLLADAGLPMHGAFLREALERLVDRLVPSLDPEADLAALLHRLPLEERDADWIASLPADGGPWRAWMALPDEALWDAVQLLAYRAAALGLSRDLLGLGPRDRELDSPFARLPGAAAELREGRDPGWEGLLEACGARLAAGLAHLEAGGISTELVYRLDLLEATLARMARLAALARGGGDGPAFTADLVREKARNRRLGPLLRDSVRLLARKVVEHTGQTGEHYIALTRAEWWRTFASAAGGGVVTTFTALFKYAIPGLALAPLGTGLAFAFNYSASFIAMQFAHLTLASKQPANTAATLAAAMADPGLRGGLKERAAGITRCQVMATLGNVLATLPATAAAALLWRWATGHPWVDPETARHSLEAMHPFRSLTIPYAILTGVMLWMASLASGWAANWSAYRRLPEALEAHRRLRGILGEKGAARVAELTRQHLGGVAGYLALGLLLGFLPVVFAFAGIHLEVRHVTLNAASLALCAVQDSPRWKDIAWALAGVGFIGVCNFGVSFHLALRTAMRARGIEGKARLLPVIWRDFLRDPWVYLGPPRDGEGDG
ncbi:MAG TPA: hypothetical protein VK188_12610 [Holophaga sp.]|nr:hypothetical protein [Holophaga sp.]